MITTYLRSSSFNTFDLCQMQFFLSYVLGMQTPSQKRATLGTVTHKVMECLARCKKCLQDGEPGFDDDAVGHVQADERLLYTEGFVDVLFNTAWHHYCGHDRIQYPDLDKRTTNKWVHLTLTSWGTVFDPRKRTIIDAEPHFDFEIEEPWAHYEFRQLNGQLSGQLRLKGTIDLVTKINNDTLEVVDWKTGRRMNWGNGEEKTFDKLSDDAQLRLYHYAVSRMYPQFKNVIMSIVFINDGGPFTMSYEQKDIPDTLTMIKNRFEEIKRCTRPKLKSNCSTHWFCTKVCYFGKTPHPKDPTKCMCQYIKQEVLRRGLDAVVANETAAGHQIGHYSSPGS